MVLRSSDKIGNKGNLLKIQKGVCNLAVVGVAFSCLKLMVIHI